MYHEQSPIPCRKANLEKGKFTVKIDMWYEDEKPVSVDCCFYPNDDIYRGNLYNADGKAIGDFSSTDSVEIEEKFPGIFG